MRHSGDCQDGSCDGDERSEFDATRGTHPVNAFYIDVKGDPEGRRVDS
jgi:hypothetical protein